MIKRSYLFVISLLSLAIFLSSCSINQEYEPVPTLKITGAYSGCGIGAFLHDGLPSAESITSYENLISRNVASVMWFLDFVQPFPTSACDAVHDHNSIPMITWEPWRWGFPADTSYSLDHIISGDCDSYITTFANAAKSWGKPLFLRFAHEMNGNWYPWTGYSNGSNEAAAEKYKTAWKRIYSTFESVGANNVTWVWCPMNYGYTTEAWNNHEKYYPGDNYVDWVAFDGYANSDKASETATSDAVYIGIYATLISTIFSNKPIMIGETARGTVDATNKPLWITDAFYKIKNNYPKIKLYVWFNMNKESGWRVDTSPDSLNAFKAAMTDEAYYLSKIH